MTDKIQFFWNWPSEETNVKLSISKKLVQGTEAAPVFTWDYSPSLSHSSASPADPVWNIKVCKSVMNWAFCNWAFCRSNLKICNSRFTRGAIAQTCQGNQSLSKAFRTFRICGFTLKICNKHLMHLLKPAWDVKVYKGILDGAFGICRFTLKIRNSLCAIIAKTCAWKSRPHWQPCPPGRRLLTSGKTLTIHYIVFLT